MNRKLRWLLIGLLFTGSLVLGGCSPRWSLTIETEGAAAEIIDFSTWTEYERFAVEDQIPLEQILYGLGFRVIEQVEIQPPESVGLVIPWGDSAAELWLTKQGDLRFGDQILPVESIIVDVSSWEDQVEVGITDLAATAASALNLSPPEISTGSPLVKGQTDAVLMIFLDAFGYLRYSEAKQAGLIPTLSPIDPPRIGLTTYPPITTVSTAARLTGTDPWNHGVETRGIRKTDQETILDRAAAAGLDVRAVEGDALSFQLRGADFDLSGDRDGSGGTDDNVLQNTLAVLEEGMPDLFLVHFHGIDDLGHEYGPLTEPEEKKIQEVDQAVGQILDRVPSGTLVLIFADHGMHAVEGQERLGNHGHLIERDMLIPIWIERRN